MRIVAAISGLGLLAATPAVAAPTVTVSNADALWKAVNTAAPGDVVQVASGSYPLLKFYNLKKAAPGVTIRAAPRAKPVFAALVVQDSNGLNFSGLDIAASDPKAQYVVQISGATRINLDHLTVHEADPSGKRVGVFARNASNITITDSEFYNLGLGIQFMDVDTPVLRNSKFHDLQTDGVDVAGSDNAIIDGNSFWDFYPHPGDHPDAIQFWSTRIHPVGKNGVVVNNVIRRGKGGPMPMQGIFAENQANMTIRGNAMVCTLYNGIALSNTATAVIEDNFVQGCPDIGARIIVRGGSSDIVVRNNEITERVIDLHQAGSKDNVRFNMKGNRMVSLAKPDDTSGLDTWLAKRSPAR